MQSPKVIPIEIAFPSEGHPKIVNINYDQWRLTITLKFLKKVNPVYVTFDNIIGFRVLDEGDLLEFWDNDLRLNSWFWNVEKGGWTDLEKSRSGFVSGSHNNSTEYLIIGINDCISIIANDKPKINESN